MRVCEIAVIIAVILLSFILAICDVYNASFIKNAALCTTLLCNLHEKFKLLTNFCTAICIKVIIFCLNVHDNTLVQNTNPRACSVALVALYRT